MDYNSAGNVVLAVGSKVDFTVNQWGESSFDATDFTFNDHSSKFRACFPP